MSDEDGVAAVTARAVELYAIGQPRTAVEYLQACMAERHDAFVAASDLARRVAADTKPPAAWEITGLPQLRLRRATPVVAHLLTLTRGGHYGGMHLIWQGIPSQLAGDVLAMLLAMAGTAAQHPEWN